MTGGGAPEEAWNSLSWNWMQMKVAFYIRALGIGAVVLGAGVATTSAFSRSSGEAEEVAVGEGLGAIGDEVQISPTEPPANARYVSEAGDPWDMPVVWNDRVAYWVEFLRGRNHDRTRLWLERSGRYGPMIRAELRARGMPEDLVYLAMIESGFSNRAYSRAHAVGIWQFIAETGRRYGLEINSQVDERRDPVKSTQAALDYLQKLYRQFGSWYLAAAAYNSGENRVERILRQHAGGRRGDDALYWRIARYLPRETRDYVPLMLAAGHIGKDPERYGFHNLRYQEPLRYENVQVGGGVSLQTVARAAAVDVDEIRRLNPQFLRGVTPSNRTSTVRVPEGRGRIFTANFPRVQELARTTVAAGGTHTVRRGETLSHIARRYGTTVGALQAANGGINPHRIRVGQRIQIPAASGTRHLASTRSSAAPAAQWRFHRVRRGETLSHIARRYGVTVRQIQAWNNMGRSSRIYAGQRIRIRV